MSCLGVHFALTTEEVAHLRALSDEHARLEHLQEIIEPHYFEKAPEFTAESYKSWDAMHRILADGKWDSGEYALGHVVLVGERLYTAPDYIISLKTPEQVRDIAAALQGITESDFRRRYFAIDDANYGCPLSEEDLDNTWLCFQSVRELYQHAASDGRSVLFTADQ